MGLQMKGDRGQLCSLSPIQPLPFGSPISEPLGLLSCSPPPSYQRTSVSSRPPHTYSPGRVCSASAHFLSRQVRLGLLEPQLTANEVLEHPPGPGSREARPDPRLPPTAVGQTHGQGMGTPG